MNSRRLLVVDDHPVNRTIVKVMLRGSQWVPSEASSGEEALELLGREAFDAVLLDISMPGLSGEEVCGKIRANAKLAGLRVIAYTAHAGLEEHEKILAAGFDAIQTKPVAKSSLIAALEGDKNANADSPEGSSGRQAAA
jgi:CheY-like chemotaxis protein